MRVMKQIMEGLKWGIQLSCICHCVTENLGEIVFCSGSSMEPTISSNDIVIIDRKSFHKVKAGDVVVAGSILKPGVHVCKRILGADGEMVWTGDRWTAVPVGHVWLQGDNPDESLDSREYGPVPKAMIRGRVLWKIWPNFNSIVCSKRIRPPSPYSKWNTENT